MQKLTRNVPGRASSWAQLHFIIAGQILPKLLALSPLGEGPVYACRRKTARVLLAEHIPRRYGVQLPSALMQRCRPQAPQRASPSTPKVHKRPHAAVTATGGASSTPTAVRLPPEPPGPGGAGPAAGPFLPRPNPPPPPPPQLTRGPR